MRKSTVLILTIVALIILSGCKSKSLLSPKNPVTLTMWHVYGEQANSPMNKLIDEFNDTVGKEKGITINVTMMSNASQVGDMLKKSQKGVPGVPSLPDMFFCHVNNASELGAENLLDWKTVFTEKELENYVDAFIDDGIVNDKLVVFPTSKSTHMLFLAGTEFDRFSAETGATYDDLATWDGFFSTAEKYYNWSGGKPFCAFDYYLRCVDLYAMELGGKDFYTDNWYNSSSKELKEAWLKFSEALVKGHIIISDMYANTQMMTGEVLGGISSSASILYYNDTITYADNSTEPTNLKVLPIPKHSNGKALSTLAGVGLCSFKTTDQKAEAAYVFASYLTDKKRNLDFVAETGYMPVNKNSTDEILNYTFKNDSYKNLYSSIGVVLDSYTLVNEKVPLDYYTKANNLYKNLRDLRYEFIRHINEGYNVSELTEKTWNMFISE